MKIKKTLLKSVNLKIWHLLLVIAICFSLGQSTGNTEIVEVEKKVEIEKTIKAEKVEEVKEIQLKLGDVGIVNRFEDKTRCELVTALTINKKDQDELMTTLEAGDNAGLVLMLLDGKAFTVDNCTQAKVIDTAMFLRKVRILEGPQIGQAGWLPMEWIRTE